MKRERVVVFEGMDEMDVPVREPAPLLALMPVFVPMGAGRGEWERAREIEAQYIPPQAASAA